jgi:hypothetical protein
MVYVPGSTFGESARLSPPNSATIAKPMPAILKKMVPQKPFDLLRALSLSKRLLGRSGSISSMPPIQPNASHKVPPHSKYCPRQPGSPSVASFSRKKPSKRVGLRFHSIWSIWGHILLNGPAAPKAVFARFHSTFRLPHAYHFRRDDQSRLRSVRPTAANSMHIACDAPNPGPSSEPDLRLRCNVGHQNQLRSLRPTHPFERHTLRQFRICSAPSPSIEQTKLDCARHLSMCVRAMDEPRSDRRKRRIKFIYLSVE